MQGAKIKLNCTKFRYNSESITIITGKIANWLFLVFADFLDMVVDTYLDFGESLLRMLLEVVV